MRSVYRTRLVSGFAAALALAAATACTTVGVQPSASPRTGSGSVGMAADPEEGRCARDGGLWRTWLDIWGRGTCERNGSGDGGAGGAGGDGM
jgi:hypothetical protein